MTRTCPSCGRSLADHQATAAACPSCGAQLADDDRTVAVDPEATTGVAGAPASADEPFPAHIGGYRVLRPIGRGGMGRVFEAEDSTGRRVALKLLTTERDPSVESIRRFRQEGRLASRISHPRCVFILAADEDAGRPFIVMELMPGRTLADLVEEDGPLDPGDAVGKILDVIDGLEEAHRLGVIHRDVKPSNCFLDEDGRVKVGDFGLSKSLEGNVDLTQSGSFLGTPLYASPEQLRGDEVGAASDIYSAAATLYFLLCGRAPHAGGDAVATVARIVSEKPRPLRSVRPGISAHLERVVMQGLEKDPASRWRDLEELRQALLPFAPGRLGLGTLALRFGAYCIDMAVLYPLMMLLDPDQGFVNLFLADDRGELTEPERLGLLALRLVLWVTYFGVLEGLWGRTAGKLCLRLAVRRQTTGDPPGLLRGAARALAFYALVHLASDIVAAFGVPAEEDGIAALLVFGLLVTLAPVAGFLLVSSTMRARTGYRGIHDLIGGTRVARLPAARERAVLPVESPARSRALADLATPADAAPESVGPYRILGALDGDGDVAARTLLAEDPGLERQVIIHVAAPGEPEPTPARRELRRPTRTRWLASDVSGTDRRDVFAAPVGRPLGEVVRDGGPIGWVRTRRLLVDLAGELDAAIDDATIPATLSPDQVWLRPDGGAQLLDRRLTGRAERESGAESSAVEADPQRRALALLYETALLGLTGRRAAADDPRLRRFRHRRDHPAEPPPRRRWYALDHEEAVCPKCLAGFTGQPKSGIFSIFPTHTCPECEKKFSTPFQAPRIQWPILAVFTIGLLGAALAMISFGKRPLVSLLAFGAAGVVGCFRSDFLERRAAHLIRTPLLARLPLHAARILERLPGGPAPLETVAAFREEIRRTRDRPSSVSRGLRAAHLSVRGMVLFPIGMAFFGFFMFGGMMVDTRVGQIRDTEAVLRLVEDDAELDRLVAEASPDLVYDMSGAARRGWLGNRAGWIPAAEVAMLARCDSFPEHAARFLELARTDLAIRLEAAGVFVTMWGIDVRNDARRILDGRPEEDARTLTMEALATTVDSVVSGDLGELGPSGGISREAFAAPLVLGALFVLLVLLSFFLRGGLSDLLIGVALVRGDGLRASRTRCAWRTFNGWLPYVLLVAGATLVEAWQPERTTLVLGLKLAVPALLAAHVGVALRFPERSPQDRMAGTYFVPR